MLALSAPRLQLLKGKPNNNLDSDGRRTKVETGDQNLRAYYLFIIYCGFYIRFTSLALSPSLGNNGNIIWKTETWKYILDFRQDLWVGVRVLT